MIKPSADVKTREEGTERILALLGDLPPESLAVVEHFVRFLREEAERGRPVMTETVKKERPSSYLYPTVAVPATSLKDWMDLVPEGYEGDALADTEALYDEAGRENCG